MSEMDDRFAGVSSRSDKHSPRVDEELEHEIQGMLKSGHATRSEEFREVEPVAEGEPDTATSPNSTLIGGVPVGMTEDAVVARAEGAVGGAEALVGRIDPLLAGYEEPLARLAPSVRRLAETLEPHEVEALVVLVDRLPTLVTHLDESMLPVLESLGDVGTDVHDLVDTMQDIREVVKGFPGSKLFRRRGREEIAEDGNDEGAQERTGS